MDRYNSFFARMHQPIPWKGEWAVTYCQTTFYSCDKSEVTDRWRKHEDTHKEQWKREGVFKFAIKYLWYSIKYGYVDNPYEVEARKAAEL